MIPRRQPFQALLEIEARKKIYPRNTEGVKIGWPLEFAGTEATAVIVIFVLAILGLEQFRSTVITARGREPGRKEDTQSEKKLYGQYKSVVQSYRNCESRRDQTTGHVRFVHFQVEQLSWWYWDCTGVAFFTFLFPCRSHWHAAPREITGSRLATRSTGTGTEPKFLLALWQLPSQMPAH
jgi:hypothetical protein